MPRLKFQNVPTASGGVVSGNISTGAGSPFGAGGKYEAQVSDIQAQIAKMPIGYYDPKDIENYWQGSFQERKKFQLLPTPTPEQEAYYQLTHKNETAVTITERMKLFKNVQEALNHLVDMSPQNKDRAKYQKVIDDHFYSIAVKPLEELREKQKAKEEEEQRQTIATLKMRVQELTKKPIEKPTAPAVTSTFPIIPIIIVAVIVGFFLLRRRS